MPQLRNGQARETRNRATQQEQQDMLLTSTLTVEGVASGSPDAVLFIMMNAVSSKLGIKLNHSTGTNLLRPHGWAESRDASGVWDGRVLFMAESTAQLQTAFALLHGQGLEVEGMSYALEVENCHVDLDGTRVTNIRLPTTTEAASMGNGTGAQQAGRPPRECSARPTAIAKRRMKRIQELSVESVHDHGGEVGMSPGESSNSWGKRQRDVMTSSSPADHSPLAKTGRSDQ
jgi:hypothetical protein